ncbi:MAG: GNAT family N-acetyltransferase [Vulcanimicrobiaceae bacterium]|jgi:phosphoribosylglycinamide formyltransferase-1
MPVNLLAALDDERFGPDAAARARERAAHAGYTLRQVEGGDPHLAAWIDAHFSGTSWSSETYAGSSWIAERDGAIAGFATFGIGARRQTCRWMRAWRERSDVGVVGPLGVVPGERGRGVGGPLLLMTLAALRARGYAYGLIPAVSGERFIGMAAQLAGARVVESFALDDGRRRRATILASGAGTNARNVLQRVAAGTLPLEIGALIANRADAGALDAAREHGVEALALTWDRARETRAAFDLRLIDAVAQTEPELLLLLGWMHLLPPAFLSRFPATINVHPSFLPLDPRADTVVAPDGTTIPALRGAHALRDALQQGVRWVGATVHGVTDEVDRGAVLVRIPVAVGDAAGEEALRERVRPAEFAAVAGGIRRWVAEREEGTA